MFRERGGSSTFARHAFNELVAFIAGWAILIDYLIVIALAAISVPHYLAPVSERLRQPGWEIGIAAVGDRRRLRAQHAQHHRPRRDSGSLAVLALADLGLQLAVIVVGALVVLHPERLTAELDLFTDPASPTSSTRPWSRCSPTPGSRPPPTSPPTSTSSRRDLNRIVSSGAIAVPLVYAGMAAMALMAVPVVAGPERPGDRARRRSSSRRRCSGSSPRSTRRGSPTRCGGWSRWSPPPVLFWAAQHGDARRLAPHLHAGDQPPDPELAGQARARATRPRTSRSRSPALIAIGLVAPDQREAAGRDLRLRRDRWRSRSPSSRSSACGSPSPTAARPFRDPLGCRWRGASCRCRRSSRRCSAASPSSASLAYHDDRALGRRRLDGLRPRLLRRLPQGLRGDLADQARLGHRAGADQAGAGGRVPQHPGADLRHRARRRHRLHRRPACRRRAGGGRARARRRPARPRLRDRGAADAAARRGAAAGARGGGASGRWSARARSARSTRTSRSAPR